jgi:hypothetical protein
MRLNGRLLPTEVAQNYSQSEEIRSVDERSSGKADGESKDRVNTLSSRAVNLANEEMDGLSVRPQLSDKSSLNIYKSVNLSVNNLLLSNKAGATGATVDGKQIMDIK